jgi:hypothetical protein
VKRNIDFSKEFEKYGNVTILVFVERSIVDGVENSALLAKIRSISVGKRVMSY